ncbi:MAG: hypothetical protein GX207_08690 [Peptococcaceae bacterium]|nr:hypothetical protein [Peptococcaceae bacterium]
MERNFRSKALEANLVETRHEEIQIPAKHQWFIDLSAECWGMNKRTVEFIKEYNHKYINYEYVLEELHNICLTDLWFYLSIPESEEALFFLTGIFEELSQAKLSLRETERLMTTLFKFIDKLIKVGQPTSKVIGRIVNLIAKGMQEQEEIYVRNGGYFKTYLGRVAAIPEFRDEIINLTRTILLKGVEYWENTTRAEEWFATKKDLFHKDYEPKLRLIGRDFFKGLREQIKSTETWEDMVSNFFFNDIANHFRQFSEEFELPLEKIHYLFYAMHLPGMKQIESHLLYDINRLLKDALTSLTPEEIYWFIDEMSSLFKEFKDEHAGTILECVSTLGKEIARINNPEIISYFCKSLINIGFIYPGKQQITSDWQVKVNPNHIVNIRVWLELIKSSPQNFRELLAALNVNLKLGGIFIADTDLFQRDITKLLNSDISAVYKQIKELARLFPVYFREIGAEGKLRDVTTAIDELGHRKDRLIHFVRKQIHSESNNTHISLIRSVAVFWFNGDIEPLQSILPPDVLEAIDLTGPYFVEVHRLMVAACQHFGVDPLGLLALPEQEVINFIEDYPLNNKREKKRFIYLIQLNSLLLEKYSLETPDLAGVLSKSGFSSPEQIATLQKQLTEEDYYGSLKTVYAIMAKLKDIILDPKESVAQEDIYYKRHIAIGIPSMYGQYREPKFEALGLMYRLEKVASRIMENILADFKLDYITAKTLKKIYEVLILFKTGLALDGMENQNFNSNLEMFRFCLTSPSFTLGQFINIFEFMALDIKEIINEYFIRFYDDALNVVVPQLFDNSKETLYKKSETFYREVLSSAFLIQLLDNFIAYAINKLRKIMNDYSEKQINNMMTYDPDLTVSTFETSTEELDNRAFLGAKAYYLKKLISYNFPVPPGFILTTEVFRHKDTVMEHMNMNLEFEELLAKHVAEIERVSGLEFGNPERPLLLSVRSGTAISLPGAMSTFLNVGLTDEIVEILAQKQENAWMTWDSYRRLIQCWGMSKGIRRTIFNNLMDEAKQKYGIAKKADFTARQMKELVAEYKEVLAGYKVYLDQEPFGQLKQAIFMVLDSWNAERAKAYRNHLQIAEEWGTAVIIQKMVMGNRSHKSGSGVVFTHNPKLSKPGINLYGDFTLCSQGEDIVAGLVHTLPISENQRLEDYPDSSISLQTAFPKIYNRLKELASKLIYELGFNNQEIEFTFESENPEDLYILQTREQIISPKEKMQFFSTPLEKMKLLGRGIGTGDKCLSGMVCFDMQDLLRFRLEYPDEKYILIRPDTVPDDIDKIFLCDGLITSRGGVTSHSSVTATKLGKTCILNCKELVVHDDLKQCTINGVVLKAGDFISIDGKAGNIFLGKYPIHSA